MTALGSEKKQSCDLKRECVAEVHKRSEMAYITFNVLFFFLSSLQIPCLCGSAPCLLCRCCPSGNNSTVTRLIYAFFMLLGVGIACIMLMPGMEGHLKKVTQESWAFLGNWSFAFVLQGCSWSILTISVLFFTSLQIPGFCEGGTGSSIPGVQGHVNCDVLVGYKAVYRVCFGMAMFFLLFSLIMVKVKSSQDPRAAVHNGYVGVGVT